jgi:hypothetical protein
VYCNVLTLYFKAMFFWCFDLIGSKGRPAVLLHRAQLDFFMKTGLSAVQMAKHFGCSASLVYKKLRQQNLTVRSKYSTMSAGQLDDHIRDIRLNNVNAGNEVGSFYDIP